MHTRFIMVRHGQTEWNLGDRFRGRADIVLNDTGIDQARRTAARLSAESFDAVYASPLARTMRTAELIVGTRAKLVREPALMDIDYGSWQGLTKYEAAQREPELYKLWLSAPEQVRFPGGERLADVRERAMRVIEAWAAQYDGHSVLLVTHDAVAKVVFCAMLGLEVSAFRHFEQDNAAINRFELRDGLYVIKTVNETSHLQKDFQQRA
jgi:broad specificity phosphatase PhoE